ncbi:MAG TPA: hypothetical protein VLE89_00650 [Chlamydiales bacterium]|nr:hypothetical protein [Chlamydiales bacterium]
MEKDEKIEGFPFLQTLFLHRKEILTGTASIIGGFILLIAYFQSGPKANTYALAEIAYAEWEAAPQDESLYQKMKKAIHQVPALEKKYEAGMAQKLLDVEKTDEALKLAHSSLDRVKEETPFHAAYARNSLLIEQGEYQDALEKAVQLKEQMNHSFDLSRLSGDRLMGGSLLYIHNLLRIACLQQQLQNRPGEKAAWEELEKFLVAKTPLTDLVMGSFSEKQIDLTNYIAERKKHL